ncbi:MerR family transcriptional regulator [Asanoa ishikariensis]|uniref:MerR family transcriptional regulator n=1 Tax=Asanoa ishikariensis TaxID=137265 RepID=UPI003CC7F9A5
MGQVAERTGLSVHALRFYEHEGLFVNPVRRVPGGRRLYTQDDVDWLTVCIILRASGMPLPRYADAPTSSEKEPPGRSTGSTGTPTVGDRSRGYPDDSATRCSITTLPNF